MIFKNIYDLGETQCESYTIDESSTIINPNPNDVVVSNNPITQNPSQSIPVKSSVLTLSLPVFETSNESTTQVTYLSENSNISTHSKSSQMTVQDILSANFFYDDFPTSIDQEGLASISTTCFT